MKDTVLYFAPHQDDELLTMGVSVLKSAKDNDTHVIISTDGSQSNIRKVLNNKRFCTRHFGLHRYDLTHDEFSKARDKEFYDSCISLGIPSENIHIDNNRSTDGQLSIEKAKNLIESYLIKYPKAKVKTITHLGGEREHSDHKNLGAAAMELYKEGKISDLELFIDPYFIEDFRTLNKDIEVTTITTTSKEEDDSILEAMNSYKLWKPKEGRYCIGYHSTRGYFDGLKSQKLCYTHRGYK